MIHNWNLSLDLLLDLLEKVLFSSLEEVMLEALVILRVTRLREVVHVELTHKRRKVVVLEVAR